MPHVSPGWGGGGGVGASSDRCITELSRTMAYTTRNTVNTLARKELNSNPVHVVLELSKEKETYTSSTNIWH